MSKRRGFSCPVCDGLFAQEDLEQHVQTHFSTKKEGLDQKKCTFEGCNVIMDLKDFEDHLIAHNFQIDHLKEQQGTSEDALLAMAIQREENKHGKSNGNEHTDIDTMIAKTMQKDENEKLEKEEFERLQKQYGMNSDGGYSKQFNDNMQKCVGKAVSIGEYFQKKTNMMSSMITGEDSNETRTQGLIPVLSGVYSLGVGGIDKVFLCTELDHYASDISDKGWGCGYRNLQMLISSLLRRSPYKENINIVLDTCQVPCIPKLQSLIEKAWKDGFDTSGCEQLGGKLSNTKKWIGTTEIVALLRWLNVRARIVDFHRAAPDKTHPELFKWVDNYFRKNHSSGVSQAFPLYLQHEGHSRTIIGVEEHKSPGENTRQILLFDPSISSPKMRTLKNLKRPYNNAQTKAVRKSLKQMKFSQFQVVFIDGLYGNDTEKNDNKVISSIRIP